MIVMVVKMILMKTLMMITALATRSRIPITTIMYSVTARSMTWLSNWCEERPTAMTRWLNWSEERATAMTGWAIWSEEWMARQR